jgi:hypothetical protein
MPKLEEIWVRKKEASAQVSAQTRALALGLLAVAWALLTAHDDPLKSMAVHIPSYRFLALAAVSVLVLVLDMLQYVATTRMAETTYRNAESNNQTENVLYDPESCAYKAQAFFYHAKFYALSAAALVMLLIFVLLFLQIHPPSK